MDNVTLYPSALNGEISVCSSKSAAHRAMIAGALCTDKITIRDVDLSADTAATMEALRAIDVDVDLTNGNVTIDSSHIARGKKIYIDAAESGSTLRFMIPVCIALGNDCSFGGRGRLPMRPIDEYLKIFDKEGISYKKGDGSYLPLSTSGTFTGQSLSFDVRGNISSQYITGLMLSALASGKRTTINVIGELQSRPYIDMTADILSAFGNKVVCENNTITVEKGVCALREYRTEKDWSQCAFFLCGGVLAGDVTVSGMNTRSLQGDKKIVNILSEMGGEISLSGNSITAHRSQLRGIDIDAAQIPDLIPILSVAAAYAEGKTTIYNAERLRVKESDRLSAICGMLSSFAVDVTEKCGGIEIIGKPSLTGNTVNSCNDHRIVMSEAIAALRASSETTIIGCDAVNKSYPQFFSDYFSLGGKGKFSHE